MKNNIHVQSRAVIIKEKHILLCCTVGLEENFYFLPGGHIEHGESANSALLRELQEEIGFDFEIKRFLGCLEYSFDPDVAQHAKCHTHEYNMIFEADCNLLPSVDIALKQIEKHIEIMWIPMSQINEIDIRPELLKTVISQWLDSSLDSALRSKMI